VCLTFKLLTPPKTFKAAIAQLAARRSHNPKVVSSILTRRIFTRRIRPPHKKLVMGEGIAAMLRM
jgi:hypothetical protein